MNISRSELESLLQDAIDDIPDYFRSRLDNVEITLEDDPPAETRREVGLAPGDVLLGLYQGVPRTRRDSSYGNVLPDKITIYRRSLEIVCPTQAALRRELREVLLHEVGHYFGMSEEQLEGIRPPYPITARRRRA